MYPRPNLLLIMPDQMRGDCLSIDGHPVLATPTADEIGLNGARFTRAYSTCASCIPARRSLLTGMYPSSNGMVGFVGGYPIKNPTLPQQLRDNGYTTVLVGRHMHQSPPDEPYGYSRQVLGSTYIEEDDYAKDLERAHPGTGGIRGLGISYNGWKARAWPYSEDLHPTNWVVRQARQLLAEPGDGKPVFLTASFYAPHPPLIPPVRYLEEYLGMPMPPAAIGSWAQPPVGKRAEDDVDAHHTLLEGDNLRQAQAGYFGLISHLDDQLSSLIADFKARSHRDQRPWAIVFTSDHGEMLGDHYFFRKCEPYEGSSRIPFLVQASPDLEMKPGVVSNQPVCLEDIMPTFLDLAGVSIPSGVDGKSLVPLLKGKQAVVREILHGEHSPCYSREQAYHFLTDGKMKYIWRPLDGSEQLFDLSRDPTELQELSDRPDMSDTLAQWRQQLVTLLRNRPEGFVADGRLVPGREYPATLPWLERG